MKAISQNPQNLWMEVERALTEHTASGYKMACIEAEKVFYYKLRERGYPVGNIKQIMMLFGWKLSNKDALSKALAKTDEIKNTFEYTLSSFEAEDIVVAYKDAVNDFSHAKALSWQRKLTIFWDNYISFRSSFAKVLFSGLFGFFLLVKFLSATQIGKDIAGLFVGMADFIFSWFILLIGLGLVLGIVALAIMAAVDKKTKIKDIK